MSRNRESDPAKDHSEVQLEVIPSNFSLSSTLTWSRVYDINTVKTTVISFGSGGGKN